MTEALTYCLAICLTVHINSQPLGRVVVFVTVIVNSINPVLFPAQHAAPLLTGENSCSCLLLFEAPHAGSGVVRMDPLRFLAGCHTRRLNQA